MHFSNIVTLALFSLPAALAAPSTLRRRDDIENQLRNLTPGCILVTDAEKAMCKSNKTPQMWKDLGIGEWLQVMTVGAHPFKEGLYNTVRDRNIKLHDTKCGDTISPDGLVPFGDCDDLTDEETCLCQPYAFFALSAMNNFVNYMEKLRLTIATAGTTVGYQVMSMPGLYNPSSKDGDSDAIDLVGGLMGIFGTLTGAIPPLSDLGIGFGLVSGVLGMVGGAADEQDPIAPIAEISSNLGHQVEAMMAAIAQYTKHVLYDIPPDTKDESGHETVYTDNPKEMVAVLGTQGAWVNEPGPIDGYMIERSLAAPAINALWNKELVIVVKVSNKDNILGVNPCDGNNLFPGESKYCDSDGTMYVLRKWKGRAKIDDFESMDEWNVPGWTNATEEYRLTTEIVAKSSEANQAGAGKYQPSPPAPADFSKKFLNKDFGHLKNSDMVYFNLPVCDINTAPMLDSSTYRKCKTPACRFNRLMLCRCAGNYFDEWASWPYENNMALGGFPYDVSSKYCKV